MSNLHIFRFSADFIASVAGLFMAMFLSGCSSDEPGGEGGREPDSEQISASSAGGVKIIELQAEGFNVDNPEAASWCEPVISETRITFIIDPNSSEEDRSVTYFLSASKNKRKITINQDPSPVIKLESELPDIPAAGGDCELKIQSNIAYSLYIPEESRTWISSNSSRESKISLKVRPNDNLQGRSSSISLLDCDEHVVYSFVVAQNGTQPRNVIYYTTTDNTKITPVNPGRSFGNAGMPQSNTYIDGLGTITFDYAIDRVDGAFEGCTNLATLSLPDGVISIGDNTFARCESLSGFVLPPHVTSIGASAFLGCKSLRSLDISSVTNLALGAFESCGLESFVIPPTITYLPERLFQYCSSLKNIKIPDGVTHIGANCFASCNALEELNLPRSAQNLGSLWADKTECDITAYITDSFTGSFVGMEGSFILPADNGPSTKLCDFLKYFNIKDNGPRPKFKGPHASADGRCLIVNGTLYAANLLDYSQGRYIFPKGIKRVEKGAVLIMSVSYIVKREGFGLSPSTIIFQDGLEETNGTLIKAFQAGSQITYSYCRVVFPATLKWMKATYDYVGFLPSDRSWALYMQSPTPPQMNFEFYTNSYFKIIVPYGSLDLYKASWPDIYANYFEEGTPDGFL